jgi:hypothetical protein
MSQNELLKDMRAHRGYDPETVLRNPERYNRAERRAAARVIAEKGKKAVV